MRERYFSFLLLLIGIILVVAWVQPAAAVDGNGLDVGVTADPSFVRTYEWMIDKWADESSITVEYGDYVEVDYSVMLDGTYVDSDFKVEGDIYIYNAGASAVSITGVSAMVSPDIVASVDCGVTYPYVLNPTQTLTCAYSADLPDYAARTVTVEVATDNSPAMGGTGFDFMSPTLIEVDECVDVVDSWAGYLGSVCVWDLPATFYYSRMIGGCVVCGYREVYNHAYFTTNDTDTTGCDSWTICVYTPCEQGCTRTQGYWKTHSEYGPAPYDDTWAELSNGADTPFFLSGQSYYQVLWTPPKKGNAYYILAHQWIAAYLNVLSGASIPDEVLTAWLTAQTLFETYTPAEIEALKNLSAASLTTARLRNQESRGEDPLRQQFIYLADILTDYNEGYVGPGHCSD